MIERTTDYAALVASAIKRGLIITETKPKHQRQTASNPGEEPRTKTPTENGGWCRNKNWYRKFFL